VAAATSNKAVSAAMRAANRARFGSGMPAG
jgi:hypothetical protein